MQLNKENFIAIIKKRPIVIWGARMTGIGFTRFSKKHDLEIISIVDSDPSLQGLKIENYTIGNPESIGSLKFQYDNLIILIAVALKEDEITNSIKGMGLNETDYINYGDCVDVFYTIDIVGTCNLRCPSCSWSMDNITNTKGVMSFDKFKKITKKMISETNIISHVSLYSWGDPLLHPKIDLFIEHLHDLGIATALSTNLSFQSSDLIQKAVRSSPEYLKISLSGYYPEVYNSTHTGGDINLVKSNLYRLKYYIEKYESKIFVDVNYHLYRNNCGKNLDKIRELCEELGFALSTTYALVMPLERVLDHCNGKPDKQTVNLSKLLLVDIDEGIEITKEYHDQPCRFLTNQVNISWDGSVPLCCVAFDKQLSDISQNYLDNSLAEISQKKENHPLCKKCMGYGLPAYNLSVNQKGWENMANQKSTTDN